MTAPSSPLATPMAWDLVAEGYTADVAPVLEKFAEDALRMAAVDSGERVLDVAAGPGTLSLLAARTGRVSAIDFSPAMLQFLRAKSRAAGVDVDVLLGDGMQLPWRDETFSAAFSMFGLMFFPDRRRGFAELFRVLRPGGRAVVSSWVPMERVPVFDAFTQVLKAELPALPLGGAAGPLAHPDDVRAELSEAGFAEIGVREASHGVDISSVREFVASAKRSNAPLMLLALKLGSDAFQSLLDKIEARLLSTFGSGPLRIEFIALLGFGVRPRRTM
jgi:ubiquinone/menaquinone biosynthesis C-methylase UbiE